MPQDSIKTSESEPLTDLEIAFKAGFRAESQLTAVPKLISYAKFDEKQRFLYCIPPSDFAAIIAAARSHER